MQTAAVLQTKWFYSLSFSLNEKLMSKFKLLLKKSELKYKLNFIPFTFDEIYLKQT